MSNHVRARVLSERDEDSESSDSNNDGNEDNNEEGDVDGPVESLVSGRAKRVTAGNRLSSLLEKEGDDDLELLFAEDEEEDIEFDADGDEEASDVQLDSSSDEEDQPRAKIEDDLEGERELQRHNRVEQLRKRKSKDVFKRPGGLRKRLKLDPTALAGAPVTPVARQRKKSERVSWIPTAEEGPIRASTRKQTVQNKEIIHLRMIESEKRRVQLIGVMEAAAKRKEASKPKVMMQSDRMEEAARTEKKNAKSLNRWEEMEKKRMADQKAKLEALQNRQLSGPVITRWSGMARWVDGKIRQVGTRGMKELTRHGELRVNGRGNSGITERLPESQAVSSRYRDTTRPQDADPQSEAGEPREPEASQQLNIESSTPIPKAFSPGPNRFLDGIHYYASLPVNPPQLGLPGQGPAVQNPAPVVSPSQAPEPVLPSQPPRQPSAPLIEYSSRNVVVLESIDANAAKIPELQNHLLLKKRNGKIQSEYLQSEEFLPTSATDGLRRARSRALRHYWAARKVPRSQDGLCIPRLVRVQGDPKAPRWSTALEHSTGQIRRPCRWFCSRGTRAVLENFIDMEADIWCSCETRNSRGTFFDCPSPS